MPNLRLEIGGRHYDVHCEDGEEAHIVRLAARVDAKARDAQAAIGGINEVRQLLFAALMLADEAGNVATAAAPPAPPPPVAPAIDEEAIEWVAARIEALASQIAQS